MKKFFLLVVVCCVAFAGCSGSNNSSAVSSDQSAASAQEAPAAKSTSSPNSTSSFKPFVVYLDKGSVENHFVPSGFMPDGKCLLINDIWQDKCHGGKTCIKINYDVACSKQGQKWAGIYWQNPANNWGSRKGGFDLNGAVKLIFWAKGDKGGERIEEFKVGGLTGDYPDSDAAVIGPVVLAPEWKQYTIDLRGKDLSYISGGFAWATNVDVNPETCVFYLDDLKFE